MLTLSKTPPTTPKNVRVIAPRKFISDITDPGTFYKLIRSIYKMVNFQVENLRKFGDVWESVKENYKNSRNKWQQLKRCSACVKCSRFTKGCKNNYTGTLHWIIEDAEYSLPITTYVSYYKARLRLRYRRKKRQHYRYISDSSIILSV